MRRLVLVALMLAGAHVATARAASVPCAECAHVAAIVDTLPGTFRETVSGKFHEDITGHDRAGCMLVISGSWRELGDRPGPADLIRAVLGREGWREGIASTDGPDGTSYVMVRGESVCLVRGRWDGGDDSDSTVVPIDVYQVIVFCAPLLPDDRRRLEEEKRNQPR